MSFITVNKIDSKEAWKIRFLLIGFLLFTIVTIKYYPLDLLQKFFPGIFRNESTCVMLNVFGIPCPFCGMSHSFHETVNFNFLKSIYFNPSSVIFFVISGITFSGILLLSLFNLKISVNFTKKTLLISGICLMVMWVLNICFGHLK